MMTFAFFMVLFVIGFVTWRHNRHPKPSKAMQHRLVQLVCVPAGKLDIFPAEYDTVCLYAGAHRRVDRQWVFEELTRLIDEETLRVEVDDGRRMYHRNK